MRFFITLLLILPLTAQSVLMIGNSYSAGTVSHLRGLLNAAPASCQFTVTNITPGGRTLYDHSTTASTVSAITNGTYSHIILQEQSQHHGWGYSYGELYSGVNANENFFDRFEQVFGSTETPNNTYPDSTVYWGTKAIIDAIKGGSSSAAQVHVFQTWGRALSAANNVFWVTGTDEEKVQRHYEQNVLMARDMSHLDPSIKVARIGEAWKESQLSNPTLNLYSGDGSHGNANGYFLAAAVLYQQITGLPVSENSYTSSLPASVIASLHTVASSYYTEPKHELFSFKKESDGTFTIEWKCRPCTEYYIEHSDDLNGDWTERPGTRFMTTPDQYDGSQSLAPTELRKFFRIVK